MLFIGLIACVNGIRVWCLLCKFEVALHRSFSVVSAMRAFPVIVMLPFCQQSVCSRHVLHTLSLSPQSYRSDLRSKSYSQQQLSLTQIAGVKSIFPCYFSQLQSFFSCYTSGVTTFCPNAPFSPEYSLVSDTTQNSTCY